MGDSTGNVRLHTDKDPNRGLSGHTVVTSFGPAGWNRYAKAFIDTFYEFFDPSVTLLAYWEGARPAYGGILPGYNLLELEPCAGFLARHRDNPVIQGKVEGLQSRWAPAARREHYSFRHDAYKFARKVFAIAHAARCRGRGRLYWIDADVVCKRHVPLSLLNRLLPEDVSLCYLSRGNYHSELGFVGYNLERSETHAFLTAYEAEYSEDVFMRRQFWDDCNVFDALIDELEPVVREIPSTSRSQPFDNSVLGKCMVHLKGARKLLP